MVLARREFSLSARPSAVFTQSHSMQARQERYEQGRQLGSLWMLECRDAGNLLEDDDGNYFQLCSDRDQAVEALRLIVARPREVRLVGIYDLTVPLETQGVGWTLEEFCRRSRPIKMDAIGLEVALRPTHGLAILCDSLAPAATPQGAAQWALETLPEALGMRLDHLRDAEVSDTVFRILSESSRQIWQRGQRERQLDGVGAAIVLGYIRGKGHGDSPLFDYFVVWSGDCRAYLWQNGRLLALTEDHVDPQMPAARPLVEYLGIGDLTPACTEGEMQPSSRLLLCNQAVMAFLNDAEMATLMSASAEPMKLCQDIIEAAQTRRIKNDRSPLCVAILEP